MARRSLLAILIAAGALACAGVPAASIGAPGQAAPTTPAPTASAPPTTAPGTPTTTASPALPTTTLPVSGPPIADVVDVGGSKPERFYDGYLAAALNDIQQWWATEYPAVFGDAYTPLEGGIYAAYPERSTTIPGCGAAADSTYQDVADAGAFYCPRGDFMAYDDGETGVIFQLAEQYGPSIVAVVMAHEFGHAIQSRVGTLNRDVPTVITEQQADCFSGAWSRRAWSGEAPGMPFTDADIELGMIALVEVRDPIGTNVLEPGGHGSAFDRIGAFQQGFYYGIEGCADLIDHPLPLQENEFFSASDAANNGNAPFGSQPRQIFDLLGRDLALWWQAQLTPSGITLPAITIRPVADITVDNCGNQQGLVASGAIYCAETNEILFDQAYARQLYDDFGDFSVGYTIGRAWADAVQVAIGSPLEGEPRGLVSDCLTGAWIASAEIPLGGGAPENHELTVSPGDLDEAVQTALVLGDPGIHDNVGGSAFERVAHLRLGVLNGLPACLAQIQ